MKAPGLPADQQFFADLFSGLVLNPQLLGRVWFASQPASLPVGSLCIDFPRLDIVLRGEYGNLLEAKQQRMVEGEMLFIPARAANLPINNKPVMLLSLVFAPTWLGLSFYDSRTTSLLHPARQIQLPSLQRGEGEAMLTALTHLSRSPLEQNIIQPLVLSLLHLCRNVVNMPPGNSQPRGEPGHPVLGGDPLQFVEREAEQPRLVGRYGGIFHRSSIRSWFSGVFLRADIPARPRGESRSVRSRRGIPPLR